MDTYQECMFSIAQGGYDYTLAEEPAPLKLVLRVYDAVIYIMDRLEAEGDET